METERTPALSLFAAFDPPLRPDTPLRMEVNLHLPQEAVEDACLYVALRVGLERLYVVRNLSAFLRQWEKGAPVTFGKGLTLDPGTMGFEPADLRILSILSEVETAQRPCEVLGYHAPQNGKFMPLSGKTAQRLLMALMARPFRLIIGKEAIAQEPIERKSLSIDCAFEEEGRGLSLLARVHGAPRFLFAHSDFVHTKGGIIRLHTEQKRVLEALLPHLQSGEARFAFAADETPRAISEILPQLEMGCHVRLSETLAARVKREPLSTRAYIDRDGERVTARIVFQYGQVAIDPFQKTIQTAADGPLLVRDAAREHAVFDALAQAGFHVGASGLYLERASRVLRFIQEGVKNLQAAMEVYASEAFHKMRPRRPQLSGRLGMSGGALQLTLLDEGEPIREIAELMQALRDKKRYFRLKDGAFLELSDLGQWEEIAALIGDIGDANAPEERVAQTAEIPMLTLRAYRAAYLTQMLEKSAIPVEVDETVRETAQALTRVGDPCPASLQETLRPYQVRGFQWVQALYTLRMGGVLADDMGLGKTLQVIAGLLWAKEREGTALSIVVAPTSLLYNWQAEIENFAPSLRTVVMEGSAAARQSKWRQLSRAQDVDVVVTSYPLLRRDIAFAQEIPFRFVVLDEAQHIKNPSSLAAVAASRLQGRCRLALTGTPMENNPGELWSIFQFVLPGYLMSLPLFMRRHGDGSGADALSRRIRPFLLRRLKAEVLPELPDKIESRVLADMPQSQRNLYTAAALRLRERVETVLGEKGFARGRMEVLSAITQLRQICCHPELVLPDYAGSSGKLDALMEIVQGALAAGRRILLFSQFTSMLAILKRTLAQEGVRMLYLDGKTPVAQRMEFVNRFNAGEGEVFLISLKAGGAGLNLTGADMVIHYDPWWNPAAEDQATDRAHRIGQKNVVQVIRLITRGTIEEQVAGLSERKRALFDAVVTAGEKLPTEMTEAEVLKLFQ